ncbi:MAG: ATP-binding protein [Ignavibacteriales bacterium]|nr:ATP-binding protein [Ignavibacteriales bacterium]
MILKKLYLENFRGFDKIEVPFNEDLNVIIGKNDVGKSTILEALEIFFNNETVKIEIEDLKVGAPPQMTIGVVFSVDPNREYLIDSERKTSLKDEYLLNEEGLLEIRKTWDCPKSLTAKSLTTYIVANYLKDFVNEPIITLKLNELKKVCTEKGLDDTVKDKRVLSDFRKAIYANIANRETQETLIPIDKEDTKKVYDSISSEFPYFALFQSDRQNKDSDKEVQDPLKIITKQAISDVETELKAVVDEIEKRAIEKGKKTIEKLAEMNPEIAKTLFPNVKNRNWDSLFSFSFTGDEGIPMNKRGSGVRRLILLNYFRAEAEEKAGISKSVIYALEEPETSQHPEHQIMLINALMKLANSQNKQVIITTHSPEIAKIAQNESLILLKKDQSGKLNIIFDEDAKLSTIRETLGIMPYLGKLVICVEGENDVKFLQNINTNIPELKEIFDFEEKNISIIPLNGGNLKNWVDRHYLKGSNVIEFHIYDRDSNSGKNTEQYKKQCTDINNRPDQSYAVLTNKREFENYLPIELYEDFFKVDCKSITDWDNFDLPSYLSSKSGRHENEVKSIINGNLTKKLTKAHLEKLNAFEEVKGWFLKMKELYQ